ncbi:hypothetical protein MD588_00130 [Photobacterium sp. SDRW27]|uniref:hypothetical protein n=1 Tax=Photobacterium obscurum TaxID=2829490 RepID=UPI0022446EF1|nr:hypothetical protein [Photobacterium obscurum]MCW8327207.1 hypothetical protein [Photobacterium obscurum]
MIKHAVIVLGVMVSGMNVAASECNLSLQNIRLENTAKKAQYDIFDTGSFALIQNHLIDIKNNSSEQSCNTVLLIQPRRNYYQSQKGLQKLDYQILAGNNSSSIYENGLAIAINNLLPTEKRTIGYQLKFRSGQYVTHGDYINSFNYAAVKAPINRAVVYEKIDHDFAVNVDKVAKISLWGTNNTRHYTVDFKEMTSGESYRAKPQLLVQSTTDYSLKFESENRGHLRHTSGDSRWDVDYDFWVNKQLINLSAGERTLNYNQPDSAVGTRYSMLFRLGSVRSKPAGGYADSITITVTPSLLH